MNIEQAREILSSCHEPQLHGDDPLVREALEMAKVHPELLELIERNRKLDTDITSALRSASVPEGLEKELLQAVSGGHQDKPRMFARWGWIGALAAILIMGAGTALVVRNETLVRDVQRSISGKDHESFGQFREGMAYYISSIYFRLDHLTGSLSAINDWLEDNQAPAYDELPEALANLDPIGCKELSWKGHKVSLVCFHSREGKIIHLFILEKDQVPDSLYQDITTVAYAHGLETGGWQSGGKVYLLVGSDADVDIEFALG